MKKSYIFTHNTHFGTQDEVVAYFNSSSLVSTWRRELPNTYFIVSEASAGAICEDMRRTLATDAESRFIVAELGSNNQGLLAKRSWSVINEKKLPPKDSAPKAIK